MKVRAIAKGFFGDKIRHEGDEFEVPDGTGAGWWEPVAEEKPVADAQPEEVKDKPARKKRAKKKS